MKKMQKFGFFALFLTASAAGWANGGPVAWTGSKPVGGIEPRQENSVELVSEELKISILDFNTYSVDANYLLRNSEGGKRISYGVPLSWLEWEGGRDMNDDAASAAKEAASSIQIMVDNTAYNCSARGIKKRGWYDVGGNVGDAWCISEIDIPEGDGIRLRLRYTAELEFEDMEFSKSAKTEFSNRTLTYPLSPAGYWNGKPDLSASLDLGPYKDSVAEVSPEEASISAEEVAWHVAGADLKGMKELHVVFDAAPLLRHRELVTWNSESYPARKAIGKVTTTSTLEQGSNRYAAENIMDGDPSTAWCEGVKGNGTGESFTIQLEEKADQSYCQPEGIAIVPGYAKSENAYLDNGRIKRMRVEDCQDSSSYADLSLNSDNHYNMSAIFTRAYRDFVPSDDEHVESMGGKWGTEEKYAVSKCFRFIIEEVVPGRRFEDTCISEVAFVRNCG